MRAESAGLGRPGCRAQAHLAADLSLPSLCSLYTECGKPGSVSGLRGHSWTVGPFPLLCGLALLPFFPAGPSLLGWLSAIDPIYKRLQTSWRQLRHIRESEGAML